MAVDDGIDNVGALLSIDTQAGGPRPNFRLVGRQVARDAVGSGV